MSVIKWEYLRVQVVGDVRFSEDDEIMPNLNYYGDQGWELCITERLTYSEIETVLVFKRIKQE